MKYLRLYWKDIEEGCRYLAEEIRKRKVEFDLIIGLARGGWVPARILSDLLDNDEIYTIRVKFYKSVGKTAERPLILHPTQFDVSGKNILLVDDIADTGESLIASIKHLKERNAGKIFVVTLVKKPSSKFTPDIFARETSAWAIFPWEVRETVGDIVKEKKSKEEILKEFRKARITKREYKEFLS